MTSHVHFHEAGFGGEYNLRVTTALNTVIGQSAVMGTAMVQKGFSSVELVCSSFLLAACPNESNDEDEKEGAPCR